MAQSNFGRADDGESRENQEGDEMNKITVEETKALCEKYGVLLLAYHADRFERLGALIDDLRATQLPQDERCPVCGEDEPFTGTCGAGDKTNALCKRPPAEPAQPVALSTLTDERIRSLWDLARMGDGVPYLTFARKILSLAASAPAQQAGQREVNLKRCIADDKATSGEYWKGYAEGLAEDFDTLAAQYLALKNATPPQPVAAEGGGS